MGRDFSHALLAAVVSKPDGGTPTLCARPSNRGRSVVPAGCTAARDLPVQTRTGAGRRLRHAPDASLAARFTLASPKPSKTCSPKLLTNNPNCWRVTYTDAGMVEKAASLWGKAGERSIARSAFSRGYSAALHVRFLRLQTLTPRSCPSSRADQTSGGAHNSPYASSKDTLRRNPRRPQSAHVC